MIFASIKPMAFSKHTNRKLNDTSTRILTPLVTTSW